MQHEHEVGRVSGGAERASASTRLVHRALVDEP